MLTDVALKQLKPQQKLYKVADRDGMYVAVAPSGQITFRYDYRLAGRRETLTIGRYGPGGVSLSKAREQCVKARQAVEAGCSPAQEKQREKRRISAGETFGIIGKRWLKDAPMADSTRAMRKAIFDRDIFPVWKNRRLTEITPDDLRAQCIKVKDRGAPATAIHLRDIVKQIYTFAILHGEKVVNPANEVGPASIATFTSKDRALSPAEIRIVLAQVEHMPTLPDHPAASSIHSATMVRKSELLDAVWDEVDFENAVWDSFPKERMKRRKPHNVYLSRQSLDIMIALKTCAGNSRYVLPSRYDADAPMSRATFNRIAAAIAERARRRGFRSSPSPSMTCAGPARRCSMSSGSIATGSKNASPTEESRGSRGVYNKAEYEQQRRHMLQEWAGA